MFRDIQVLFFLDKNQDFTLDLSVWAVVLQYIFYNKFFSVFSDTYDFILWKKFIVYFARWYFKCYALLTH